MKGKQVVSFYQIQLALLSSIAQHVPHLLDEELHGLDASFGHWYCQDILEHSSAIHFQQKDNSDLIGVVSLWYLY